MLPINLIQFIIHTNKSDVINTVVAIVHTHKNVIVIRPEYRDESDNILFWLNNINDYNIKTVLYGDGFNIDTWDEAIKKFTP